MAEKGFGVKEINLIGASGTPTIESPNNLNLNAVNVAISTNVSVGGTLTVSGSLSIGGTITYEDVTNVDAIGIVTAREGIFIPDNKKIELGNAAGSGDIAIYHNGSDAYIDNDTGGLRINTASGEVQINKATNEYMARFITDGAVQLYHNNNERLATSNAGITVTGQGVFSSAITASTYIQGTSSNGGLKFYSDSSASKGVVLNTDDHLVPSNDSASDLGLTGTRWRNLYADTLYGDGSNLTGIAVTEAPVTDYTISANGSSAYRIHGGGVDETANSPDLYLIRGQKYRFNNTTGSGHPFAIRVSNGGSAYTDGVSGSNQGIQFFTVPYAAPASLVYQCTIHSGMIGNIYIRGGASTANISNNADNRIITGGSGGNLNGESTLTYTGSALTMAGDVVFTNNSSEIKTNTSDGSDNKRIILCGGGDNSQVRGAQMTLYGNEYTSHQGRLQLLAGNSGNSNGVIQMYTGGNERLRIDSSGNVSIHSGAYGGGGTAPQLYVRGTGGRQVKIHNSNAGTSSLQITNGTTGEGEDAGTQLFTQGSTGDFQIQNAFATGDIAFSTKPSGGSTIERFRILSDGRIGINDSTPNDYELDIMKRSTATDANLRLYNNATGSNNDTILRLHIAGTSANNYIYFGDGDDSNAGQIRYNHGSNYMSFHSNGTEQLKIHSSGAVTKPNNPIFFAYMDSSANHNSGDALKLDHTELNVGSGYNTSNYRFTPPVDGHYMFHGSANLSLGNGEFTRSANVRLYKNGSLLTYQTGRNTITGYQSSYPSVDGTFMVYGTTSDYFTCVVSWETGGGNYSSLNTTETLHPHGTKFMGYLIG